MFVNYGPNWSIKSAPGSRRTKRTRKSRRRQRRKKRKRRKRKTKRKRRRRSRKRRTKRRRRKRRRRRRKRRRRRSGGRAPPSPTRRIRTRIPTTRTDPIRRARRSRRAALRNQSRPCPGIDFTKLHFGKNVFGQISSMFKCYPKITKITVIIYIQTQLLVLMVLKNNKIRYFDAKFCA
jgi:hypothetical protein